MILPADTDFLVIEIAANENIYNDQTPPEFDGHYADAVTVFVTPESATLGMLALGGLALVRRRERGGTTLNRSGRGEITASGLK